MQSGIGSPALDLVKLSHLSFPTPPPAERERERRKRREEKESERAKTRLNQNFDPFANPQIYFRAFSPGPSRVGASGTVDIV